jgi:hypothetical protein
MMGRRTITVGYKVQLTELATNIGASTEVASQLLETYSIDLANITPKEVESLKIVANPGKLSTKAPKKVPDKQLGGDPELALTRGTTATLTAPEAPTIEATNVLPPMTLSDVTAHFEAITAGASLPIEQAAREGILRGAAIAQGEASITDNFLRTVVGQHYQARISQQ